MSTGSLFENWFRGDNVRIGQKGEMAILLTIGDFVQLDHIFWRDHVLLDQLLLGDRLDALVLLPMLSQ